MNDETVGVEAGRYIRILEERIGELVIETLRLRSVIDKMTDNEEATYQTDERGELVDD